MRIERIEKSKHKQERVLVFLEGGDLLRITGAELLRFGLYKGMDLSPALVVELQAKAIRTSSAARFATLLWRSCSRRRLRKLTRSTRRTRSAASKPTRSWLPSNFDLTA